MVVTTSTAMSCCRCMLQRSRAVAPKSSVLSPQLPRRYVSDLVQLMVVAAEVLGQGLTEPEKVSRWVGHLRREVDALTTNWQVRGLQITSDNP
eukprot:COSAG01_NODE_2664_length_7291_cov_4.395996_12_plen_93_part_00